MEAWVETVSMPAHSSHATQPQDCALFASVKAALTKSASPSSYGQHLQNIRDALDVGLVSHNGMESFLRSGEWPIEVSMPLGRGPIPSVPMETPPRPQSNRLNISGQPTATPEKIAE